MELCRKVQVEEYVIHVVESSQPPNFYTHLRFSLLASTWFPRPLGLALWSVFHMLVVVYMTFMLLAFFSIVFATAFSYDALTLCALLFLVLVFPFAILLAFLPKGIVAALVWIWLVISCTMPGRSPDQGLGHYILSAGGLLNLPPRNPQLPVMGAASPWAALKEFRRKAFTVRFVKHGMVESFLFVRLVLGTLSREIVPLYDTVVI